MMKVILEDVKEEVLDHLVASSETLVVAKGLLYWIGTLSLWVVYALVHLLVPFW